MSRQTARNRTLSLLAGLLLLVGLAGILLVPRTLALFTDTAPVPENGLTSDTLDVPTALTASCGASVTLDWTATADTYASGHRLFRSTSPGGPYSQIAEITPRATVSYVDSPPAGTQYYLLRSFFQNWESIDSGFVSAAAGANCSSFGSVADTYANEEAPTENKGTEEAMSVKTKATAKNQRSFVRFDVSSIPASSTIQAATLTLCLKQVSSGRTYDVHRASASWAELTLNWNNQPIVEASPTDSAVTPSSLDCMSWTVTADVQAWVDGTANDGWRISDSVEDFSNLSSKFYTREKGDSKVPKLDVTYVAASGISVSSGSYVGDSVDGRGITGVGFAPALVIVKCDCARASVWRTSTMVGDAAKRIESTGNLEANLVESLDADGFTVGTATTVNASGDTYYWTAFSAGNELSLGTYTGDGTDDRSIAGVGFQPVWVVTLGDGEESMQRQGTMVGDKSHFLWGGAFTADKLQAMEADGFQIGTHSDVNASGITFHYVAFDSSATVAQASYVGDGTDNRSITGVGFQPQLLWVKRTGSNPATWRPSVLAGDASMFFGSNGGAIADRIQILEADGFQAGTHNQVNASGDTIHYLAFK